LLHSPKSFLSFIQSYDKWLVKARTLLSSNRNHHFHWWQFATDWHNSRSRFLWFPTRQGEKKMWKSSFGLKVFPWKGLSFDPGALLKQLNHEQAFLIETFPLSTYIKELPVTCYSRHVEETLKSGIQVNLNFYLFLLQMVYTLFKCWTPFSNDI